MRLGWTASPSDRELAFQTDSTNPSPEGPAGRVAPRVSYSSEGKRTIQTGSGTVFRRSDAG